MNLPSIASSLADLWRQYMSAASEWTLKSEDDISRVSAAGWYPSILAPEIAPIGLMLAAEEEQDKRNLASGLRVQSRQTESVVHRSEVERTIVTVVALSAIVFIGILALP